MKLKKSQKVFACFIVFMLDIWGSAWVLSTLPEYHWAIVPMFMTCLIIGFGAVMGAIAVYINGDRHDRY